MTLFAIMYVTIFYYIIGFNTSAGAFFTQMLISILMGWAASGIGILMGCLIPIPRIAIAVSSLLFVPMATFGGYYMNVNSLKGYISWM